MLLSARFAIFPLLLVQASAYGQLIIFDDFSASGGLDGTTPDVGPANWAAYSTFSSDGLVLSSTGSQSRMATIDLGANYFVGNPGIYDLSMRVDLSTNTTEPTWWGLGFSEGFSTGINNGFNTTTNNTSGSPWMLLRQDGRVNVYAGPATSNPLTVDAPFATNATHTIKLVLDASAASWTLDAYVDSTQLDLNGVGAGNTYTFETNPTIRYVGMTSNINNITGFATADNFRMTVVPEPSEYALLAVGAGLFAIFSRWRRAASRARSGC